MKRMNLKKLMLATAIVGASSLAFAEGSATTSGDMDSNMRSDMQDRQTVTVPPRDQNITNPNTEGYSTINTEGSTINTEGSATTNTEGSTVNTEDRSTEGYSTRGVDSGSNAGTAVDSQSSNDSLAGAEPVDGTVHFEPNSVTLTESAEMQLKKVVDQIDKNAPIALTIEVQGAASESDMTSQQSLGTPMNQDSSTGFPSDERGVAGARMSPTERGEASIEGNATLPSNNADAIENEREERAQLISRYRAENVRQYLERQGIEVVEWNMEGGITSPDGSASSDTGFATRSSEAQSEEQEVQQVRIVVVGDVRPEGLSAL